MVYGLTSDVNASLVADLHSSCGDNHIVTAYDLPVTCALMIVLVFIFFAFYYICEYYFIPTLNMMCDYYKIRFGFFSAFPLCSLFCCVFEAMMWVGQ